MELEWWTHAQVYAFQENLGNRCENMRAHLCVQQRVTNFIYCNNRWQYIEEKANQLNVTFSSLMPNVFVCECIENNEFGLNSALFWSSFLYYFWFPCLFSLHINWLPILFFFPLLSLSHTLSLTFFFVFLHFLIACLLIFLYLFLILPSSYSFWSLMSSFKSVAHHSIALNKLLIFESHLWIGS